MQENSNENFKTKQPVILEHYTYQENDEIDQFFYPERVVIQQYMYMQHKLLVWYMYALVRAHVHGVYVVHI